MLWSNYWSQNLIGLYHFFGISPRNSTLFTRPFLTRRETTQTGYETSGADTDIGNVSHWLGACHLHIYRGRSGGGKVHWWWEDKLSSLEVELKYNSPDIHEWYVQVSIISTSGSLTLTSASRWRVCVATYMYLPLFHTVKTEKLLWPKYDVSVQCWTQIATVS